MKLKIEKMGINGEGIGYLNKKPVFITGALPSEQVEVGKLIQKDRYAIAELEQVLTKSKQRVTPPCPVQEKCGGCPLMILDYKQQLKEKELLLEQALYKYAKIRREKIQPIHASPEELEYRNLSKLPIKTIRNQLVSGLYEAETNYFVPIDSCLIHQPKLEKIRQQILEVLNQNRFRSFDAKTRRGLRYLLVRGFDSYYQCVLVTGSETIPQSLIEELMKIDGLHSIYQSINADRHSYQIFGKKTIHLAGAKTIEVKMDSFVYRLSPQSFFQLNSKQAIELYRTVADKIIPNAKLVVEAYSGVGGISLYLKDKAERIIGIESIKEAVHNANENARLNKAKNVEFKCGDAEVVLKNISKKEQIDVLVVDPPRSGLTEVMIETINKSKIKQLIYISCNPSTLGKNLEELQKNYEVEEVIPFDMFPQTPHVETLVLMSKIS